MDPRYNIYFAGTVVEGHDRAAVRGALGKLFKADESTLDKLFSGRELLIKRGCDEATALKYKQAMERAGAVPVIRPEGGADPIPVSAPAERKPMSAAEKIAALAAAPDQDAYRSDSGPPTSQTSEAGDEAMDLAPTGADVLRPEERPLKEKVEVDTSNLSLDQAAGRLSEAPAPPPPAPDTSHLTMGEVGETIPVLDKGTPASPPTTDHIALAPSGTDFSDCTPPEAERPDLDLSGLDLAPAGSDVLEEQYRHHKQPPAPDTDHLSLED